MMYSLAFPLGSFSSRQQIAPTTKSECSAAVAPHSASRDRQLCVDSSLLYTPWYVQQHSQSHTAPEAFTLTHCCIWAGAHAVLVELILHNDDPNENDQGLQQRMGI
eukprot:723208-Pyramimonas_sp.AAC.1